MLRKRKIFANKAPLQPRPSLQGATKTWKRAATGEIYRKIIVLEINESSSMCIQRVAKNQELDLVEGSIPSKTEKGTVDRARTGNVEVPAPTASERQRERGRLRERELLIKIMKVR
jgi:hypothetical protein